MFLCNGQITLSRSNLATAPAFQHVHLSICGKIRHISRALLLRARCLKGKCTNHYAIVTRCYTSTPNVNIGRFMKSSSLRSPRPLQLQLIYCIGDAWADGRGADALTSVISAQWCRSVSFIYLENLARLAPRREESSRDEVEPGDDRPKRVHGTQ